MKKNSNWARPLMISLAVVVVAAICAVAFKLMFSKGSSKRTLQMYIWCDYISPEVVHKFEEQYDCKIQQDIFDSNEMMFAKLQQGGDGYDIVCPSHYYIKKMAASNMIQPLDWSKMPMLENLDAATLKKFEPEVLKYAVPYFMSYTGIGYSTSEVKDFIPTWDMFLREDLCNRMTLLDDYAEVLGAAARKLGYDFNDLLNDESKMQEAVDVAVSWRQNIIKFDNEQYKNGLATGEFLLSMGYFSDLSQIVAESDSSLALALPVEGCMMSCDMLVIPTTAKNADLAYEFINFVNQPENAAQNITDVYAYCPNLGALDYLDEEVKNDTSIFVSGPGLDNALLIPEFTEEENKKLLKAWDKVRRGTK